MHILILKFAFLIITVISSLFTAYLDYGRRNKGAVKQNTKLFRKIRFCLYVSLIISAVLGVSLTLIDDYNKKSETEDLAKQNQVLNQQIDELKKQTNTTQNLITGGDSYCFVLITPPDERSQFVNAILINDGKYTVRNIQLKIQDVEQNLADLESGLKSGKIPTHSQTESELFESNSRLILNIGDMPPHTSKNISGLLSKNEQNFHTMSKLLQITVGHYSS